MGKLPLDVVIDRVSDLRHEVNPVPASTAERLLHRGGWDRSSRANHRREEAYPENGDLRDNDNIEIVFTLAYDRRRRTYILASGDRRDSHPTKIDEESAIAVIEQVRLGSSKTPASLRGSLARSGVPLNRKELLVLQAVADGLTNRAAATRLHITENTTKRHLQSIFAKLGVSSRTQAVMVAVSKGWIALGKAPASPSYNCPGRQ